MSSDFQQDPAGTSPSSEYGRFDDENDAPVGGDEAGVATSTSPSHTAARGGMCANCRDVCSYFPLDQIVQNPYFSGCAEDIDVFEAASKRRGTREIFRKQSCARLPTFLNRLLDEFMVEEEALSDRLEDLGMNCEDKGIWYLTMADIDDLDRLIAVGFDPRAVSKESLYGGVHIGEDYRQYDVYAKSTFDALVARGFAFDEADLIVLDERMEPALRDLPALIRGETDD